MNPLPFVTLAAAAILCAGPVRAQQAPAVKADSVPLDAVVAIVGDTSITRYDVWEQYLTRVQSMQQAQPPMRIPTHAAEARALLDTVINSMIDNAVLLAKAKEYKIEVPDFALAGKADEMVKAARKQFTTEAEFQDALAKAGLGTPDDYRKMLIERARTDTVLPMVVQTLRDSNRITPVNVSEDEVEAEFTKLMSGPDAPTQPPTIQFRQMIIAPRASPAAVAVARAKAESLLVKIKAGANFEDMAKQYSMDPGSKAQGGDLGSVPRGKLVPEFDRVLFGPFALKPGQISPVTETVFGFHIIRVDKADPTEVHVHHILIQPVIDSADVAKAQQLGDSVAAEIRRGVPFDSLARHYNDYAEGEDAGLMGMRAIDELPETYRKGLANAKPGDVVTFSIPTPTGVPKVGVFQVVSTTPAGPLTLEAAHDRLRAQLSQAAAIRRALDTMRKQVYIRIDMTRVHSIVDELGLPPSH